MKKACCIYRIDDVTPGMDWQKFNRFLELFQKYHVVPLLGVVPRNMDPNLTVGRLEPNFWGILKKLRDEGKVEIAQHGYQHIYATRQIQPFYRFCGFKPQSEFYGLSQYIQVEMIRAGKEILQKNGIATDIFMAPGHSFDQNTVKALKKLKFKAVTDGIGLFPVRKAGIVFVPQQVWNPGKPLIGVRTVCLHLNYADEALYRQIENHLKRDRDIVPFSQAPGWESTVGESLFNQCYKVFFACRALKNKMSR